MICSIRISIVINAALGKYIRYLLPYSAFAGTDGANSFQQFTEIILAKGCLSLLQAFVIHSKALYHIFLQNTGCPYTESGCLNSLCFILHCSVLKWLLQFLQQPLPHPTHRIQKSLLNGD